VPPSVGLYNSAYENYSSDVYRDIRIETYGEDLGQTSWVTNEESAAIPSLLHLTPNSRAIEIGCGSGRYALRVAERVPCSVLGLDINSHGIENANQLAQSVRLSRSVNFQCCDASQGIPAADASADGVFANDVLCHVPDRPGVFRESFRVLKPGARLLFSDALIIGGLITHQEIATRSSIGYYIFSPPGENQRLLEAAGFQILEVQDTTANSAEIAGRWHDARQRRAEALIAIEGHPNFDGLQRFLDGVRILTSERRLLRHLYVAAKPAPNGRRV
jgi:ubiquinone/menaquinone biosynthesis C-methylase UbiE